MKFSVGFPLLGSSLGYGIGEDGMLTFAPHQGFAPADPFLYSREFLASFLETAAASGFDAVHVSDHPAPSERWLQAGGHEALDPFAALAYLAGLQPTLRLLTQLAIVPYRNPVLFAKAAASVDRLSGGRLTLGLGTGYLKSEFHALGTDFAERNALFDEALAVCRAAWSGAPFSHEGLHFSAKDVRSVPSPVQDPLPLWIGGNSRLSRQRAAEHGEGWLPQPNPRSVAASRRTAVIETLDDLAAMIDDLHERRRSAGRPADVDVMFTSYEGGTPGADEWQPVRRIADLKAQAAIGVTWHQTNPAAATGSEVLDMVRRFGDDVIAGFG